MVNMPDLNVLQRATLESEVATLKAKLAEAHSQNRRVKKIDFLRKNLRVAFVKKEFKRIDTQNPSTSTVKRQHRL
jgi:hypothetical protein